MAERVPFTSIWHIVYSGASTVSTFSSMLQEVTSTGPNFNLKVELLFTGLYM